MSLTGSPPRLVSSEPNISELDDDITNVTCRYNKRKWNNNYQQELLDAMDEMKTTLSKSIAEHNQKLICLQDTVVEIKKQNEELNKMVQFMSDKYDEIRDKLLCLETERKENHNYINQLETKVETLEKNTRSGSLEVRNIPKKPAESKRDLVKILESIGTCLKTPIQSSDIRDIFRVYSKGPSNNTIIVELTSVLKKEDVLNSIKAYKKEHKQLPTTTQIKVGGPSQPVYISENLTTKGKRLYALARDFAKSNEYKYCWTAHGSVYIRKKDGEVACRINNEESLTVLLKQK